MADTSFWTTSDGTNLAKQYRQLPPIETDPIDGFRQAIADAGLPIPDHIDADGQMHRFSTNGKTGDKAGYYCLHLDGTPAGFFGCWRGQYYQTWSARNGSKLDAGELKRLRANIDKAKAERAAYARQRAEKAQSLWLSAQPAKPDHSYLKKKGVSVSAEIRQADIERAVFFDDDSKTGIIKDCLLVPVETSDGLQSLQAITPDGSKMFLSGGAIGSGYCALSGSAEAVYLVEGLATGLSVREATGCTVVVAFNSGNLSKVAERIRGESPAARIVIAGDNDHGTEGNPGKAAAEKAAATIGAKVLLPPAGDHGTDWNDYHAAYGIESVRAELKTLTEATAPKGLGFTMVGDMVKHLKPIDWLVKGFLEADSLGLIYGPPKCGKSFLAIDWACSIATGTAWNGRKVKQGSVFYLAGEGHNGLARRFAAWQLHKGVSLENAALAVSNRAAPLVDADHALQVENAVSQLAEQHGEPAVIIVDTLARNFGADENSTQDMNTFVKHLDDLRSRWKATVIVVHHTGKDASRGARGSVALTGAIDAGYSVTKDELGNVNLEPTEMKDAELPSPMFFSLEGVKLPLVDEDGNDVYGAALQAKDAGYEPPKRGKAGKGKNQTLVLGVLSELYRQHGDRLESAGRDPDDAKVSISDWRAACLDVGVMANRFSESKKKLAELGLIEIREPYVTPM